MLNFTFNKLRNIFITKNKNLKNNRYNMVVFALFTGLFFVVLRMYLLSGSKSDILKEKQMFRVKIKNLLF